jgi:succinate-semialdehyde dehydrogenase/glutarate-semialdehyde dehydrogenase
VDALVQESVRRGAQLITGGHRVGNSGHFYAPTLLTEMPHDVRMMREEPFGPVAPITRFSHLDEAIRRANETPYGLAAYAFTRSAETAIRLSEEIEAGMVGLNSFVVAQSELPFTGIKDSGHGSESGMEGLDAYMVPKTVTYLLS